MSRLSSTSKSFLNKRAYFDYHIIDTIECGIALIQDEIKVIRSGKVQLKGSFAKILQGAQGKPELFIVGMYLGSKTLDTQRTRKLLVKKNELSRLIGQVQQKGMTLIPTKLFFKRGLAKIEIGTARAKKKFDKREAIKAREHKRDLRYYFND
ncbi:MAG: SsrA-binding protein [Candidatus Berkelbacteria bacterium Licking1014_7]|uniref:SsrA-binding protein n=1 Tax=Candidatus Berkelbacteria bacterium Licking1014_7 TaxID=2017147 RepID=A0A554LKG0_9BACT|nr:MAG: SsrA-binding protein [Candidatus Berkelbacteria bacterium Licking1014_7]